MRTLISGSFAYDTIMVFPDQFKNHLPPRPKHGLNVCFNVPQLRREFGGCAGNIAYNLKLLGGAPVPMGAVGEDFTPYRARLAELGIDHTHIHIIPATYTAQAFITTDADNNQIIAFHPGAMQFAHQNKITAANLALGIVAPNGKQAMLQHSAQLRQAGIPFIFDPGQALPLFDGAELRACLASANYAVVNEYEAEVLLRVCAMTCAQIAAEVDAFIVTRGGRGADIYHNGECLHIPAAKISAARDPTGCGDAFRAGLLYGLAKKMDWQTCGRIAALLGAIKIEQHGTQNHIFTREEFAARYRDNFGEDLPHGV